MRRPPAVAMSALTVAVVGISLRASTNAHGQAALNPASLAPVGVMRPSPAEPRTPAPPARAAGTASPSPAEVHAASPAPRRTSAAPTAPLTTTINGQAVDTQYGPVQVQVRVRGHRIARSDAINYPQAGGRDQEINSQAIPQLDQEALQAQSAHIDSVSGATYTSDGYRQSLQSALDAAHRDGAL